MYKVNSPILLIVFNRPEETQVVFDAIRKAKPDKLYIAADGPRASRINDTELCKRTIEIVSQIDWPCVVATLYRQANLGCKYAVSTAISWFFKNELEGIILEDDCLPVIDFFKYCDTLLAKYRDDNRIRHISGARLDYISHTDESSYYYSRLTQVWGWASWRRVWSDYDVEMKLFRQLKSPAELKNIFHDDKVCKFLFGQFYKTWKGEIDTWDYQYVFSNLINNGLSVVPNVNLISNIGFSESATHTSDKQSRFSNIPLQELPSIEYSQIMIPNSFRDLQQLRSQLPSYSSRLKGRVKRALGGRK